MACTALAACITFSGSPLIRSSPSRLVTATLNSFSSKRTFSSKEPKILTACSSRSMLIRCSMPSLLKLSGRAVRFICCINRGLRPEFLPALRRQCHRQDIPPEPGGHLTGRYLAVGVHKAVEIRFQRRPRLLLPPGLRNRHRLRFVKPESLRLPYDRKRNSAHPNRRSLGYFITLAAVNATVCKEFYPAAAENHGTEPLFPSGIPFFPLR